MSRTYKDSPKSRDRSRRQHNISVRGIRKDQPDLRKLSRALIQLAMAQAESEAAADDAAAAKPPKRQADD